ncbi:cadherin-like domain-containing protein [Algiphilus sp. NNCM1]|uniref:PKD domain-containing protein n=1 Tax=Algiphilus sp. TaxID=1872431 RepID=UPI001CA76C9A|nr:Ig-like domain-containing protein [Algiphilus sp.]MBY8965838.1 cadherin-like domain-containing protein [Algiphilus acroporae]MCI5061360.1 Ig-like domain-containing protein [Algiphilus sp.]MCI5102799.1 Ig-like domain-containing protein [Algiphilus sp.]
MTRHGMVLCCTLLVAACSGDQQSAGSGGSSESASNTGRIHDSPIQGLRYTPAQPPGSLTDADGVFRVPAGTQRVRFFLGDLPLGEATMAPLLTIADLVPGAEGTDVSQQPPAVTNLARLLQSCDADGNPDNGLQMPPLPGNASVSEVVFDQSLEAFAADQAVATFLRMRCDDRSLVSAAAARAHFQRTLDHIEATGSANRLPTVDAGSDRNVAIGSRVTLDGTASDGDGSIARLAWTQTAQGPQLTLQGADTATPQFVAPAVRKATALQFVLEATDDDGAQRSDSVTITVLPGTGEGAPPVALDARYTLPEDGRLDAVLEASDPDSDALQFTELQRPANGQLVLDTDGGFTYHPNAHFFGQDRFGFRVTDEQGRSDDGLVDLEVTPVNDAPNADAGANQSVVSGTSVTLDGRGSSDIEDALAYDWSQTAGVPVNLAAADTAQPSFIAPEVADRAPLHFQLRVTDRAGLQGTDTVTVEVVAQAGQNRAPIAEAGSDQRVQEGTEVVLDGAASSDLDGDIVAFQWRQEGGATVALQNADSPRARFTAPPTTEPLPLQFVLRVTDDDGATGEDRLRVIVDPVNAPPTVEAQDQTVDEGDAVTLDASASRDSDGSVVGIEWQQLEGPPVTLDGPESAMPSFTAPEVTQSLVTLRFRVTVTDNEGARASRLVRVFVRDVPVDVIRAGAAKRTVTPEQRHIDGIEEARVGGSTHLQKFNLGGFGIDPTQNLPDPFGSFGDQLTQPAGQRVFEGSRGEEHTWLRALMLERRNEDDTRTRIVFLVVDAVGAGNIIQQDLKAAVSAATGIAPNHILFGQTHTHAGADLQGLWGGVPQDWIQTVLYPQAVAAVQDAMQRLQPAEMRVKQIETEAFNNYRRPRVRPDATADHTMTLLQAVATDASGLGPQGGDVIGSLLQYNAHPTSVNEDPRTPHADFILGAVDWLEDPQRGGGVALYFNGPIADASSAGSRAGCEAVASDGEYGQQRCKGEGMADAVLFNAHSARSLDSTLDIRTVEATLPVTNPAFIAAAGVGAFNRYYDFLQPDSIIPFGDIPGIGPIIEAERSNLPQVAPVARTPVTRITIGGAEDGLEIVTIPGEATNTFGETVQSLAATEVMFLGLTHNAFGYIIPEEEFSYLDPGGGTGLGAPYTNYEEFVSLGPLTAPLLRVQAYNVLFDAPPEANVPPWVSACADPADSACVAGYLGYRLDHFQREHARMCREMGAPEAFCEVIDPDTPFATPCQEAGLPDGVCAIFGAVDGGGGDGGSGFDTDLAAAAVEATLRGCDVLDPAHCLFPFPSDHFTVTAAAGAPQSESEGGSGRRVNFNPLAMPRNIAGKPIDPTEWNRNDGFSPGQLLLTYVPNVATVKDAQGDPTGPIVGAPPITDIGRSLDVAGSSVVVIDATAVAEEGGFDPARHLHPVWAEIDLNAGLLLPAQGTENPDPTSETRAAMLIRPGRNFEEGHRYVVVLKDLVDEAGQPIAAQAAFASCRDQAGSALPPIQSRCQVLEEKVFSILAQVPGIDRESVYLAWDFTVASANNNIARLRHMRDDAFINHLGQEEDAQGHIVALGAAPAFTVDRVLTENLDAGIARRVEGTITVPSYVIPADPAPLDNVLGQLETLCARAPQDDLQSGCADLFEAAGTIDGGALPPNRLFYNPLDALPTDLTQAPFGDGLPDRTGTLTTRFTCQIPAQAGPDNLARPGIYGHGLLDGHQAVGYDAVPAFSRDHNMLFCAVDLFGFSTGDLVNVLSSLVDLSNFAVIPDASQQGLLNYAFLARLLRHPDGFAAHPAFREGDSPVFDNREVFYDGNSQGGIVGGVATAISKDIRRGVLGVVGMNYSTLLRRSVDFDAPYEAGGLPPYALPLYLSYPDDLDRDLGFALIQMLWDRSENNGYAHHMTDNSALRGPDNQLLLQPAFADHQVTHWSAQVMARTIGVEVADLYHRRPGDGVAHVFNDKFQFFEQRDPDEADYWNLPLIGRHPIAAYDSAPCAAGDCRTTQSALITFDAGRTATPPIGNVPPRADDFDPHGYPRATVFGMCQKSHFLHPGGRIIDVVGIDRLEDCPALPSVAPADGDPGAMEPGPDGRGDGLIGVLADAGADMHPVLTALLDSDPEAAAVHTQAALEHLAEGGSGLADGFDPARPGETGLGIDGELDETVQRLLGTARDTAPVVVTGDRLPGWSVPAARGVGYPYPSGAAISGELLDAFGGPGQVRNAHNGQILYPVAGTLGAEGIVPVEQIAAYRYDGENFIEIPVQVDERAPYFLANANSDFSTYSGTDPELSYVWDNGDDTHTWGDENWMMVGGTCERDYPEGVAPLPDPVVGLDNDDEIVFMASDAGALFPGTDFPEEWQRVQLVTVIDPLQPDAQRVVYLVVKAGGSRFTADDGYVDYARHADADQWIDRGFFAEDDPEKLGSSNTGYGPNLSGTVCPDGAPASARDSSDRFPRDGVTVTTDTYRFEASGRWMVRDLRVRPADGADGDAVDWQTRPDLVDRWKGRAFQQSPDSVISLVGFEDEQVNWEANSALIGERCGPVRCIRETWGADSGTNVTKTETFYRDAISYHYRVRVHPIPPDGLYTSWDYNRSAMVPTPEERAAGVPGGRYYTTLRPQGVPIDGVNDDLGNVDGYAPLPLAECIGDGGPQPPASSGRCPAFFDAADPTFNLPLAFSNWEQVSGKGGAGSLVYSFELVGLTSLANPLVVPYYRDDACLDDGTGDDPVPRPFPGESYDWRDGAVRDAYNAAAGRPLDHSGDTFADCLERQGAHGSHGVHYFVTHDSDNAFTPITSTEIDARQWQYIVPTAAPHNLGEPYANNVRVPLQVIAAPVKLSLPAP